MNDETMPRIGIDRFWELAATHILRTDATHMGMTWAKYCKRYGLSARDRVRYETSMDPAMVSALFNHGLNKVP